jgi:predicted phosphodiesterase
MFQVKVWFKRKQTDKLKEVIEFFKTELQKVTPKFQQKHKPKGKYLYEISIPDLHLSKLPTQGLWDACEEFKNAVSDLISRVDLDEIEKIVLPIGNDFFNSEGMRSSTTAGTPQKDAHPWQKSFKVGCQLITDVVDQLAQRVNIDIVIVSGNHDFERCFYLGEYLGAWYRKNEAVTVNNGEENRKYYTYGKNLIMWTHGSEEKQTDIPLLMARESKNWSACKYYFAHLGHFHHDWLRDMKGIKVRVLPSLCPPDFWHSSKGYLGSTRSALGFLYDSEKGEVANYYYNL